MNMNVKELINIINEFEVKVIFDSQKQVKDNIMRGQVMYFTPVEGKERKKFENKRNKSDFISTTASIHIPDLSIEYLINIFECDGTGLYEFTKELIKPFCNMNIQSEIAYVIFLFLHEVGHWQQFINLEKNVEKFINLDIEERINVNKKFSELEEKRKERMEKGNNCPQTFNEKKLCEQYMQEYRAIPMEKDADEFALKHMAKIITKYKDKINLSTFSNQQTSQTSN